MGGYSKNPISNWFKRNRIALLIWLSMLLTIGGLVAGNILSFAIPSEVVAILTALGGATATPLTTAVATVALSLAIVALPALLLYIGLTIWHRSLPEPSEFNKREVAAKYFMLAAGRFGSLLVPVVATVLVAAGVSLAWPVLLGLLAIPLLFMAVAWVATKFSLWNFERKKTQRMESRVESNLYSRKFTQRVNTTAENLIEGNPNLPILIQKKIKDLQTYYKKHQGRFKQEPLNSMGHPFDRVYGDHFMENNFIDYPAHRLSFQWFLNDFYQAATVCGVKLNRSDKSLLAALEHIGFIPEKYPGERTMVDQAALGMYRDAPAEDASGAAASAHDIAAKMGGPAEPVGEVGSSAAADPAPEPSALVQPEGSNSGKNKESVRGGGSPGMYGQFGKKPRSGDGAGGASYEPPPQ